MMRRRIILSLGGLGLVLFGALVMAWWMGAGEGGGVAAPARPETLTRRGEVREFAATSAKVRAFLNDLETAAAVDNWRRVWTLVQTMRDGEIAVHPAVRAFALVAETREGGREFDHEREMLTIEAQLSAASGDYGALLEYLRAARAQHVMRRLVSEELVLRNLDELVRLLDAEEPSAYTAAVRMEVSQLLESFGDRAWKAGRGVLRNDALRLQAARAHYRDSLKFLVKRSAWPDLAPIGPAAESRVPLLVEKIRQANLALHGFSLPFTGRDSATWSGLNGGRVHAPEGAG